MDKEFAEKISAIDKRLDALERVPEPELVTPTVNFEELIAE